VEPTAPEDQPDATPTPEEEAEITQGMGEDA
jgi:hypothetical protein